MQLTIRSLAKHYYRLSEPLSNTSVLAQAAARLRDRSVVVFSGFIAGGG